MNLFDHIASSVTIEPDDLELAPFNKHGGLGKPHQLFGNDLPKLIKGFPIFLLCFLCVYPHRLNAGGIRWLATQLDNLDKEN